MTFGLCQVPASRGNSMGGSRGLMWVHSKQLSSHPCTSQLQRRRRRCFSIFFILPCSGTKPFSGFLATDLSSHLQ